MGMKRKFLAWIATVALMVGLVPGYVQANNEVVTLEVGESVEVDAEQNYSGCTILVTNFNTNVTFSINVDKIIITGMAPTSGQESVSVSVTYFNTSSLGAGGTDSYNFFITVTPCTHSNASKIEIHEASPATCEADGNDYYVKCNQCGKIFSDANKTQVTTLQAVTRPKTGHNYPDTYESDSNQHWRSCVNSGCTHIEYSPHTPGNTVIENQVTATTARGGVLRAGYLLQRLQRAD